MRIRSSVAVGMVVALGALAALAQPRGRGGAKPKPPKTQDAGAEIPTLDDAGGSSTGVTTSPGLAADGGSASPVSIPSFYDGGQKPSPLNPAPNELPSGAPPAASAAVDYDKLLGDISALRARVATVGDTLFHSRIAIALQTDGDHAKLARLTVALDDGIVYTAQPNFRADDMTVVYDHAVAPGRHAVTIDVERKDDREEAFRTAQRSRLVVDVPKDQRLSLEVKILDDSTMGGDFPGDRSGKYDLRVKAKAVSRPVTR